MNQVLVSVTLLCLIILGLTFLLKKIGQPPLIAYIVAGILLGPHCAGLFPDNEQIESLGELGILFMMFFLGMEIDIPDKKSLLLQPVIAQSIKMLLCVLFAFLFGRWMNWTTGGIVLLTVILAFNSTAIVNSFLTTHHETGTGIGKTVLNILLLQDILLAPVYTAFRFVSTGAIELPQLALAIAASILILLLLRAARNENLYQLPMIKMLGSDHELQVFAGTLICFGFASITALAGLSAAVGSFAAGIFIGRTKAFHWLDQVLHPFKVFFVAIFFVSIGLRIDLSFIAQSWGSVLNISAIVLLSNAGLSAIVFRLLKYTRKQSIYAGALLSQTGEFGILACTLAFQAGIIESGFFKLTIAVTCVTLLISTLWMSLVRNIIWKRTIQQVADHQ